MIVEKKIFDWLAVQLTCPVYVELPVSHADTFVKIQRTGSVGADGIRTATVAVQSYAPTLYAAAQLNETVKQKMLAMSAENVFGVTLNSDYEFTNTNTKQRRYQAVFNISYKE